MLDASAALALCFRDEASSSIDEGIRQHGQPVVPSLWLSEVTQGLLTAERRGRLTSGDVLRSSELLRALAVRFDEIVIGRILGPVLSIAREHRLTVYDASYLELAIREQLPLATLDSALERAAREAGVGLLA